MGEWLEHRPQGAAGSSKTSFLLSDISGDDLFCLFSAEVIQTFPTRALITSFTRRDEQVRETCWPGCLGHGCVLAGLGEQTLDIFELFLLQTQNKNLFGENRLETNQMSLNYTPIYSCYQQWNSPFYSFSRWFLPSVQYLYLYLNMSWNPFIKLSRVRVIHVIIYYIYENS